MWLQQSFDSISSGMISDVKKDKILQNQIEIGDQ